MVVQELTSGELTDELKMEVLGRRWEVVSGLYWVCEVWVSSVPWR